MTTSNEPISNNSRPKTFSSADIIQRILNSAREAVLIVDHGMRVAASNPVAYRAFGRGNGPLEERRLSEVIRDAKLHESFRNTFESGQPSEIKIELIGNDRRNYDIHIAPLEMESQKYAIGFFYDVTKIERLERVRQEFLSNISHELRTPLTSIIAFVETLEDGAIDDKENNRRFLGVIHRNAERMHSLIADILELSLIESGNISIEKGHVRLAHLVGEIFASLSSKAAEREIKLIHEISDDVRVLADPGRLEQMLTNLIDNAIKFNRPEGTVEVVHMTSERASLISVADTGEGIPSENLPRVFERFYRLDRGRTREIGGTGLGLAIVKHLARLHGGEVSVESELGSGTTFTIELPLS